jgi:drug/metabolite transporter (DMT)-like permease
LHLSERATRALHDRSILLVFLCTLIGASAQIFFKLGAEQIAKPTPIQILLNPSLFLGYALYGISTALLVLALRKGQLSILYPIISLTYVWVTLLSMIIFKETLNISKLVGLAIVVAGVAVLGKGAKS